MKLIIDIPEDTYYDMKAHEEQVRLCDNKFKTAILDGTPLPKGHGRLVDVSELLVSIMKYMDGDKTLGQCIDDTPTIIEADGAESEDKE